MPINLPPVPAVPSAITPDMARFLGAVKQIIETREGTRASGLFKFLTAEDVTTLGGGGGTTTIYNNTTTSVFDESAIDPPSNFTVTKTTYYHNLSWTNPVAENFSHTEVWWNTTNDLSTASLLVIVTGPQHEFHNLIVADTNDHYYWIRAISFGNASYSPWRPVGTGGDPEGFLIEGDDSIGASIDAIMDELTSLDETNFLNGRSPFLAGMIDGVQTVGLNGTMVVDGTLLARHIKAGEITAAHIAANQITASKINTSEIFVGLNIRSTTYVPGSVGWSIAPSGTVEFNSGVFRGTLGAGIVTADSVGANQITSFTALIGDKPPLNATPGGVFYDDFRDDNFSTTWQILSGGGFVGRINTASARSGGYLTVYGRNGASGDQAWLTTVKPIPFDPTALYRIKCRVMVAANSTAATVGARCGVAMLNYAKTYLGANGAANEYWNSAWVAQDGALPKDSQWHDYEGYFRGHAAAAFTSPCPLASAPGELHINTRYFQPLLFLNAQGGGSVTYVDQVSVEILPERKDSQWAYSNTTYIDGGNIYTGSIHADSITANTITTGKLIGGAITTSGSAQNMTFVKAPDFGEVDAVSLTLTTVGGPVVIWAYTVLRSHGYITYDLSIRMDGTIIYNYEDNVQTVAGLTPYTFMHRHSPSAGTHTWVIKLQSQTSTDMYLGKTCLIIVELKR